MIVKKVFDLTTPGAAVAVVWASDGSAIAAASQYGDVLTVWDSHGHRINQFKREGGGPTVYGSIAFVAGSSRLVFPPPDAVPDSAAFSVWDVATGSIVRTVSGPQPDDDYPLNRAEHFMTSPDQAFLAMATFGNSGSRNLEKNVVVYDTRSWRPVQTMKVLPGVSSLCVFGSGRLIGLGTNIGGRITVMELASGLRVKEIQAYEESPYGNVGLGAVAGSPAGDLVMTGAGLVTVTAHLISKEQNLWGESKEQKAWVASIEPARVFRIQDGARIASISGARAPIRQAKWDPKGRYVAFVDSADGLFLWAPSTRSVERVHVPGASLSLDIAPDGDRIAVTTNKGVSVYSVHLRAAPSA
jgi:WD40 repeat protein